MQETASSALKSEDQCRRRHRLHRNLKIDAGDGVVCIEIGKSMQQTVSPALKSENQCRRRRRLHRNPKIDAGDGVVCIEI
jgi:hypothetical protein